MAIRRIALTLLTLFACSFHGSAERYVWLQKSHFGGGGRYVPFGFTIGNMGYAGSGLGWDGSAYQYVPVDFWRYDPSNDTWTQMADVMGPCKSAAAAFVLGQKGYVTTGWTPTQTTATYAYDVATNSWSQKANFGGSARYSAVAFAAGGYGFVGTGYSPLKKDFWRYDPVADSWTQVADVGGLIRQAATGFALNGYGYVFGGTKLLYYYVNELWQYDHTTNTWNQKASLPASGRYGATGFVMNGKAFVGGGSNYTSVFKDYWQYDPVSDSWQQIPDFEGGLRQGGFFFSVAGRGFTGAGSAGVYPAIDERSDLWELIYNDANRISGKLFVDYNNNGVQDAGEQPLADRMVRETTTGEYTFTRADGSYDLYVFTTGTFTVTTGAYGVYTPVPAARSVTFAGINQSATGNDFAFQAGSQSDLCVRISPSGSFRAGYNSHYVIHYQNKGNTTKSITVVMYPDDDESFVTATVSPSSVTPDSIVWSLGNLSPNQSGVINVTVSIAGSVPGGTPLEAAALILPVAGDVHPECNYDSWTHQVAAPYDPNRIEVNRDTVWSWELSNAPWLEYLIRFQNVGSDTAVNVHIQNKVPVGTLLSSFEFVSASSDVQIRYIGEYDMLEFRFDNINLPDSTTDEAASYGFIRYRIKPMASLNVGEKIYNSARIFFDFNPEVYTNTVQTTIGYQPVPLPVSLVSFAGTQEGNRVKLRWITATEINNAYFLVERSADGVYYEPVASVQGHGTTTLKHEYTVYDDPGSSGSWYYRLRQVDYDGQAQLYGPVQVTFRTEDSWQIVAVGASPDHLSVTFISPEAGVVSCRIVNLGGQVVYAASGVEAREGLNTVDIPAQLSSGVYVAILQTPAGPVARKFFR